MQATRKSDSHKPNIKHTNALISYIVVPTTENLRECAVNTALEGNK